MRSKKVDQKAPSEAPGRLLRYRPLSTEGAPGPPETSNVRVDDGCGPWAVSFGWGGSGGAMVKMYEGLLTA